MSCFRTDPDQRVNVLQGVLDTATSGQFRRTDMHHYRRDTIVVRIGFQARESRSTFFGRPRVMEAQMFPASDRIDCRNYRQRDSYSVRPPPRVLMQCIAHERSRQFVED